jgi:MFS superfamily sulfate permease-like transporter
MAQGQVICVSGLIGGMPVTSVIVRSSVNAIQVHVVNAQPLFMGVVTTMPFYFCPTYEHDSFVCTCSNFDRDWF